MGKYIGAELFCVCNHLRRSILKSETHKKVSKLTGNNGRIINYIQVKNNNNIDVFQKDVEKEFNLRRSTVSKVLQLMEQKGLIIRESVETDARLKRICLTDISYQIADEIKSDLENLEAKIGKGITTEDSEVFFKVLQKIKDNLESDRDL